MKSFFKSIIAEHVLMTSLQGSEAVNILISYFNKFSEHFKNKIFTHTHTSFIRIHNIKYLIGELVILFISM